MGTAPGLNSLALDFLPISHSKVSLETVGKRPRANFLNTGEVLRAHDRILGEQNSALHFLDKFASHS